MPNIKISVKPPFDKLAKAFNSVDVDSFLRNEINKIALQVERYGKQLSPVRTGRLRASIHTSPAITSLQAIVQTGTDYAIYVHEGTRYMRARPFMEKGAELTKDYIAGELSARLDETFAKAFKTL